ncbi:hypothetical protein LJR153_003378 [Paenibacillus sp. LjRoot153]|uniref:hypothetical protein n=1 Tax=Paenibacillus sp. LjRoot153 TaxID=3342270 RepID=UPI003ECE0076
MERKINLLIGFVVGLVFMLLPTPVLFILGRFSYELTGGGSLENIIQTIVKTIGLVVVITIGMKLILEAFRELKGK